MVVLVVIASAVNNIIDVGMLGLGKKILARDLTGLWSWRQYSRGFLFERTLSCKGYEQRSQTQNALNYLQLLTEEYVRASIVV